MKPDRALPILIYCDIALTFLAIVVDRVWREFLPAPLRDFLKGERALPWRTGDWIVAVSWAAVIAATVLAWIGLLNLWRPARAIYFWSWLAALLLLPLESAWILSPAGYLLDTAASLVGGTLLGVLYFSDAREHFGRTTADTPEAGAVRI
jgi:hypothetical protein